MVWQKGRSILRIFQRFSVSSLSRVWTQISQKTSGSLTLWISWISMDIMDIHGHFWIYIWIWIWWIFWISMLEVLWISNMDIHFGYVWMWIWWISKRISKIHIHIGYPCPYRISMDIHGYYGYPTWISCLDIHNIHDIQWTKLYERVDEDYPSYPEVHHFRAETLS